MERIDSQLIGIGELLKTRQFTVPPYQRPYSWTDEQVTELIKDLSDAIAHRNPEYFLGTIVVTKPENGRHLIIDGQQRLVTVSLLLGAIRDYFDSQDTEEGRQRAHLLKQAYLSHVEARTLQDTPRITLINEDNAFYTKRVIAGVAHPDRSAAPVTAPQKRLAKACDLMGRQVGLLTADTHNPHDRLFDWRDFLTDQAKVIVVEVKDEGNAYVIFEVLNDRGLELSISDLLKNYLFRRAGSRVSEAQEAWVRMTTTIAEGSSEADVKNFIRHVWASRNGVTRERELYDQIKRTITTEQAAVDFSHELAQKAVIYSAFGNATHDYWQPFNPVVAEAVSVLDLLKAAQIRPLLIALLSKFSQAEVQKALPMMSAWAVRFLIKGAVGSGTLESYYSERAKEITEGTITTAEVLWSKMRPVVPTDDEFKAAFAAATVSQNFLARHYLRVLEKQQQSGTSELIVNPSEEAVTLEHILPQNPGPGWEHFSTDQRTRLTKRIGNLALLDKALNNNHAGNADFNTKKQVYARSRLSMTAAIAEHSQWGPSEIERRQQVLADLAVTAWRAAPR